MTPERPPINFDAPPGYQELALDRAYDRPSGMLERAPDIVPPAFDRLTSARERQARADVRIAEARHMLVVSAVTAPTTETKLNEWADRHTDLMTALLAEIRARVIADDDARRALASMKGGA